MNNSIGITNSISFKSKIIDSHTHVGRFVGADYTKEQLDIFVKRKLPNKDKVEKMFVSDLDILQSAKGEYEGNVGLLKLFKNDCNYEFFASCSPKDGSVENIKRLFKENPNSFLGLKFHPSVQNLPLADKRYAPYLEFANTNAIPCLFHSEVSLLKGGVLDKSKVNISDPELIYNLAKKYPKVPVIMAHMGAGWKEAHDKAIGVLVESVKNGDTNLYADISWVNIDSKKDHILKAIKRLKGIGEKNWKWGDQSFRLMFGSDAPLDRFKSKNARKKYAKYIDEIKTAIREDKDLAPESEKIIDDLFYNNAKKLYKDKIKEIPQKKNGKKWVYIISGIVVASLLALMAYCSGSNKPQVQKTNKITLNV